MRSAANGANPASRERAAPVSATIFGGCAQGVPIIPISRKPAGSAGAGTAGTASTCAGAAGAGLVILGKAGGTGSEAARTVPTAPIAAAEKNHRPYFMSPLTDPEDRTKSERTPIRWLRETIGHR